MKPLEGLTVVDASTVLAGPSVGTFLAELGASVTKFEHPKYGDVTRSWKLKSESSESTVSAYFSSVNYLKDYKKLDLSSKVGLKLFLDEIRSADILVTNFKNGDAEKFGIDDDTLQGINPRLINAKINGYGEDSDRVAYDLILQAESGFMSMNGTPESGPVKMPVAFIDVLAAHHLKEGILLALYEREKTGKGKSLSTSLYDAAVCSLVNQATNYLMGGHIPERIGSLHPNIAPYGELFETVDNSIITFAIGSDTHFKKLCRVLELTNLEEDGRFKTNQDRVINRKELFRCINNKIKLLECEALLRELEELNVPAGKVKNLEEVFRDKEAQNLVRTEVIDGVETKRTTSVAFK